MRPRAARRPRAGGSASGSAGRRSGLSLSLLWPSASGDPAPTSAPLVHYLSIKSCHWRRGTACSALLRLGLPEMTSASPPEFTVSLLSDEEKWFFDNFGYLVLKQAVPPNDATELLVELDGWLSSTDEPPTPLKRGRQDGSTRRENVVSPHYGSAAYQRLNLNAEILRVVSGMMMGCPRLMHTVATKMWRSPADEPPPGFHRDTDGFVFPLGFRNPHNDFQASGGELYASHVATWVALVDVPEGTGFSLVPGSHKSSFEAPELPAVHNPPVSITVPLSAGDVIVFSTNLLYVHPHASRNPTTPYSPIESILALLHVHSAVSQARGEQMDRR